MRAGTSGSANAPVEVTMRSSSTATPASGAETLPVAITTAPAETVRFSGPSISTVPGPVSLAWPSMWVTSFFSRRPATPLVRSPTTLSLCAIMAGRSSSTPEILTPWRARCVLAWMYSSEVWSSAFDGMQPTLRQVPPRVGMRSTQAVFRPSWAARMAAT